MSLRTEWLAVTSNGNSVEADLAVVNLTLDDVVEVTAEPAWVMPLVDVFTREFTESIESMSLTDAVAGGGGADALVSAVLSITQLAFAMGVVTGRRDYQVGLN